MPTEYIKSPLNYTGGKFKILSSIIPLFPKKIRTFVDLFAGGFNVGINVSADKIIANDHISYLIELYQYFYETPLDEVCAAIDGLIQEYELSQENGAGYNRLRSNYNKDKTPIKLFVLACFSFNHQIRFNNSFEFNTPFGKARSSYNSVIKANLIKFCTQLKQGCYQFTNLDFRAIDFSALGNEDVVYCDPPYLITSGSYNDGKRGFGDWAPTDDKDLLAKLDEANEKGITFFLSNVFYHKGLTNDYLIEWSKKYRVISIDKNYSNCSYHFKDRGTKTVEVLVTNMEVDDGQ